MSQSTNSNFMRDDVKIVLSEKVSAKIDRLLISLNTEVGFHGLVEMIDRGGITYLRITDILIYPQIVTGCQSRTDDLQMVNFYMENAHQIKQIRYHGHSHVSMPTIPSSVDVIHMKEIISTLPKGDFYIFQIFNRYDRASSIIYMDGKYSQVECIREIDSDINYSALRVDSVIPIFHN